MGLVLRTCDPSPLQRVTGSFPVQGIKCDGVSCVGDQLLQLDIRYTSSNTDLWREEKQVGRDRGAQVKERQDFM